MAYNPCGTDGGALVLNDEVLENIFVRGERILGKAVFAAKCSVIARYPTQDTMYGPAVLYTLFGDPALRLKLPQPTGIKADAESPARGVQRATLSVFPNPVNGTTTISYSLPAAGKVSLKLYNVSGKLVTTLATGHRNAGNLSFVLCPSSLAGGAYLLRLETANANTIMKLIVE